MGFKSIMKHVVKIGGKALPIAAAFGVPFAGTAAEAVAMIHKDGKRSNDDASSLLATTVDALDERVSRLEQVYIKEASPPG